MSEFLLSLPRSPLDGGFGIWSAGCMVLSENPEDEPNDSERRDLLSADELVAVDGAAVEEPQEPMVSERNFVSQGLPGYAPV